MPPRDYQSGELVPGTVYRIVRPIGAGGMGTVYDVEDTTIDKRYVLKTLHPRLGRREDLARRMQNEARILARLHHPNIVEVITAGVTADDLRLPFFVMERLDGQSLRVVLERRGRLELPHAYNLVIDLLDALDHAHDRGIVHRDVKPDNIFLHRSPSGSTVTKLLDFGIVSLLDDTENETSGRFLGTLRYAAPEQLRGEKPTPKTDVYAAALVLYEILAGRGPFDDEAEPHRISQAHLHQRPPPIARFVRVPSELNGLLMAALDKDPAGRPRDAFSFAASLRNIKRVYPEMPSLPPAPGLDPSVEATVPAAIDEPTTMSAAELPVVTAFDPVGGVLSTHSAASSITRIPNEGTEALTGSSPAVDEGLAGDDLDASAPSPQDGPEERPVLSEEPQVRSLPVATPPRRSRAVLVASCIGAAGLLGAFGLLIVRSSHVTHDARRAGSSTPPPSEDEPPPTLEPLFSISPPIAMPLPEVPPVAISPRRHGIGGAAAGSPSFSPSKSPSRNSWKATSTYRPGPGF